MEKLIPDWAVQFNEGCGCKNFKNKMNKWGIQGCKDNRKKIIDHLMKQSSNLVPVLKIFPNVMKRIGVNMLLDKAISNAEKNYILVNGPVPGKKGNIVQIQSAVKVS